MLKIKEKGKKSKLLDSSDSELEDDKPQFEVRNKKNENGSGFNINKNYAERYDNWRNLEEMQKLKSRLGVKNVDELNESGDSSESSSEEDEEWSTEKEKAFLKTLACLKKKDPKIYDGQFGYFKDVPDPTAEETKTAEEGGKQKTKKGDNKPFTVRDHERVMVMEKGGQVSDEEDDNRKPMSYPEELASIKTAFSKALKDIDSSDDEEAGAALGSNLLKKRIVKSEEEQQLEKEAYKLWLKGELDKVEKGKLSKEDKKDLKFLKEYWNDDKLDEGEKFLRDYILNKNYIEPLKGDSGGHIPSYNEVVHDDDELSDDEKFEAEREEFEHKYNFRFEEPDQEFIKRYPRTIQDSLRLRKEEGKRKEQRDKAKERKEEAKSRKREEVQRLKALKRKEILDKIEKLHEISGNPDLHVTEMDIEGDFDPEEYDRRMQQIFNDDYYEEEKDGVKPVFPYDEELDNEVNFEEWTPADEENQTSINEEPSDSENDEDDGDKTPTSLTDDQKRANRAQNQRSTQQELIEMSKGKRNRRKRSVFLEALERQKPQFDPKVHKSFEQYFDEYYKLDFEDLVGDLPCRFKYHKTTANDFGLSVNEILKASDKELNQWASLKKTFQYRDVNEEEYEVKAYMKKAEREDLKKRFIPSVYQNAASAEAENESDEDEEGDNEKQKKKRKKKNKKKNKKQNTTSSADQSTLSDSERNDLDTTSTSVESTPKKKKNKRESNVGSEEPSALNGLETDDHDIASPSKESSPKKKKNKRQRNAGSEDQSTAALETDDVDTPTPATPESSSTKKKNKKQKSAIDESTLGLETEDLDTTSASVESSPLKKAKKVKPMENDYVQYKTSVEVPESSPNGKSLSKRQRKNLKRKSDAGSSVETPVRSDTVSHVKTALAVENEEDSNAKQKKRTEKKWKGMKRKSEANDANGVSVDDARLEAYGLNPKKFKKRMKYGASLAKS